MLQTFTAPYRRRRVLVLVSLTFLMSKPTLQALAGLALLTIVFTFPLSTSPASTALDLGPDTRLFLWTLSWDVHAFVHAPLAIFDANIFFPQLRTLAYSEHQIGSALIAAPVLLATGDPLLAMNLTLLLSCLLSGLGAFVLARELGLGLAGAWFCAIVFAFAPPRLLRLGQLHLATVQWIPFCLALVHRFARGGTTRHAVGAALLFTLQAWSGGQSGLFLALSVASLLLYSLVSASFRPTSSWWRDALLAAGIVAGLNAPMALPYFQVRSELGLSRSLAEAQVWSPNAESFAASPSHAHRWLRRTLGWEDRVERHAMAFLFPGMIPIVMGLLALFKRKRAPVARARPWTRWLDATALGFVALAALIEAAGGVRFGALSASGGGRALVLALVVVGIRLAVDRKTRFADGLRGSYASWASARMGIPAGFYVWLLLLSLWASLGPSFGLYEALYHVLPGFDFIRVPSRLTLLSVLALAVLGGYGVERWAARSRLMAVGLCAMTLVELAAFPLDAHAYMLRPSPMDEWLSARDDDGAVAVFPIPDPFDEIASARSHSAYMLSSIVHFRPLVNGYSGFTPKEHENLFRELSTFPDAVGVSRLRAMGVRYAVFHRAGFSDEWWEALASRCEALSLSLMASFDEGRVYAIDRQ